MLDQCSPPLRGDMCTAISHDFRLANGKSTTTRVTGNAMLGSGAAEKHSL